MKFKNVFWGLFFIVGGILVIANQLGYLVNLNLFSLFCTILLIPIIIKSAIHLCWGGIFFPIALLGIIYAGPLGITNLVPWPILIAALFATIGFSFIIHPKKYEISMENSEHFDQIINNPDSNVVSCKVSFGSSIKYVNTDCFETGKFECSFGALKVYFNQTEVKEKEPVIYLDASFSGVEIYVPKTWKLINRVNCSLGGIEEKNVDSSANIPVRLEGNVKFSGVEIIHV